VLRGEAVATGGAAVVVPGKMEEMRDEKHAQMPDGKRMKSLCYVKDRVSRPFGSVYEHP
jgi:hypothetical protein